MRDLLLRIWHVFFPLKTIDSLPQESFNAFESYRDRLKVLIIDDNEVPLIQNLRNMGYNIKRYSDIPDLDALTKFPIIIADVQGVGKSLKLKNGGIEIIRQSQKTNPLKEYGIYSAATYDLSVTIPGVTVIEKDFDSDDWSDVLDSMFERVMNPRKRWKKIQHYLIDSGVTSYEMAKLEDEYVRIVEKGESLKDFPKVKNSQTREIYDWIQALIKSAVLE